VPIAFFLLTIEAWLSGHYVFAILPAAATVISTILLSN
jgi:hypothetical protein